MEIVGLATFVSNRWSVVILLANMAVVEDSLVKTGGSEAGIGDTMVNRWLGWRSGSQANPMVSTYYTPQDLDGKVQSKHPFIKLWKS